jgi:microcystin-dependent protein
MAIDIKISELNEITQNSDLNQIIVNDRESTGDSGVSKKISIANLLTPGLVKSDNILNLNVTTGKINTGAVTCDKIAGKSITCDQIADNTICNALIQDNQINNRKIDNSDNFTVASLNGTNSICSSLIKASNTLTVDSGCVNINNLQYIFPTTQRPKNFLKTDGAGNLSWDEAVPGDGTSLVFEQIFPVGTIIPYGGAAQVPNDQWLPLDGSARFDGRAYPELSAALGTTWGDRYTTIDGSIVNNTTGVYFTLPNMSGRVPIGQGTGTDNAGNTCSFGMGSTTGLYCQTLNANNIPAHTHCYRNDYYIEIYSSGNCVDYIEQVGSGLTGSGRTDADNKFVFGRCCTTAQNSTSNSSFSVVQPVASTRYIIKAKPDHIQQFAMNIGPGLSALDALGAQTSTFDLSSTELGLKIDNTNIKLDGSNKITLVDNVSASSIRFDDGTVQTSAPTNSPIIAYARIRGSTGALVANSGFASSVRTSAGRYTLRFETPRASGSQYIVTATREKNHPLEGDVVVLSRSTLGFSLFSSNDDSSPGDPDFVDLIVVE